MSELEKEIRIELPLRIPLFPLPNVVLFPQMWLPLHIFEQRYRQLAIDALTGEKLIGMVMYANGPEVGGVKPVEPVGCVGRVEWAEELQDGRFNLLLLGLARFVIVEEHPADEIVLYRRAKVRYFDTLPSAEPDSENLKSKLLELIQRVSEELYQDDFKHGAQFEEGLPLGSCADAVAATLPFEDPQRQLVLAEPDAISRAKLVLEQGRGLIAAIQQEKKMNLMPPSDPRWN